MPHRRPAVAVLLLFVVALALSACGAQTTASPTPNQPLRFGYDLWPGYYPVLIAQSQGYFKEEGLTVEAIAPGATDVMLTDFNAGKYDAIAVALGDLISLTQANPDLKIVFVTDESAGGDAVVAAPGTTLSDLRGKRIGVNHGGFAELLVVKMLEEQGLTAQDVTLIDMDASELPARLAAGHIDAGHAWEPYVSEAVAGGGSVIFSSADTPGLIPDAVAFRGSVVRERPDDVRAFVNAWFKAVDYWKANPDQGTQQIAGQLNLKPEDISLQGIKLLGRPENNTLFQKGDSMTSLYHVTQLYIDFYSRIGALRTLPDVNTILDPSFISQP